MKLVIYNGSPRGRASNSRILIDQFLQGYHSECTDSVIIHYLTQRKNKTEWLEDYNEADIVLIIFPLYTDCMPGLTMEFFEHLVSVKDKKPSNKRKRIGFIVQSGFPEGIHCEAVTHYLIRFTERLNGHYLGTVTKGAVEGIQYMTEPMTRKLFGNFEHLGRCFALNNRFDSVIVQKLRSPYQIPLFFRLLMRFVSLFGLTDYFWNKKLKENGAFEHRFSKPFLSRSS